MLVVLIVLFALVLAGYAVYLFWPTLKRWFQSILNEGNEGNDEDANDAGEVEEDNQDISVPDDAAVMESGDAKTETYVDPYASVDTEVIGSTL